MTARRRVASALLCAALGVCLLAPAAEANLPLGKVKNVFFVSLRKQLVKEGGGPDFVNCVVGEMRPELTAKELRAIAKGKLPKSVAHKSSAAGADCGTQFPTEIPGA